MIQIVFAFALAGLLLVAVLSLYNAWKTRRIAAFAEATLPPAGKFVIANGRKFHIVEKGEGPAILFIHGLGGTLHHFDIPLWDAMGGGYRLIAVDRRGSGYSEHRWGDDGRITTHASDMAALLDALGIHKAVICGHSLGGAVTLAMAENHPEKVAGIALIAPLTVPELVVPAEFKGLWLPNAGMRRFIANTFAVPASIRDAEKTLDFVFGPQKPPADYAITGRALIGVRPSHIDAASTDFVAINAEMPDIARRVGEISVPAAVIFGTHDRVLDPLANGTALVGRIEGLSLEMIEGTGHMVQFSEPQKVAAMVRSVAQKAFTGVEGEAGADGGT